MTRIIHTYDDLSVRDTASITRVVTPDLYVFAYVSGNLNPLYLPVSRSGNTQSGRGLGRCSPPFWERAAGGDAV